MKKYSPLVSSLLLLLLLSCGSDAPKQQELSHNKPVTKEETFLKLIDSLNVKDLLDEAKWRAYCYKCEDTVKWRPRIHADTTITMGSLDINLTGIKNHEDTIGFLFCYAFPPRFPCDSIAVNNACMINEIGFSKRTKKVLYYFTNCNFSYSTNDPSSRFYNPAQGQVVSYIKQNEKVLNSWFRNEALRRGVL